MKPYWYKAKVIKIIDGDTVDLSISLGFNIKIEKRIRLAGIDTPEIYGVKKDSEEYQKGIKSKERLEELIAQEPYILINTLKDKTGKYGRLLAYLYLPKNNTNINTVLLNEQLATPYLKR